MAVQTNMITLVTQYTAHFLINYNVLWLASKMQ